jgi:hypothetical protein
VKPSPYIDGKKYDKFVSRLNTWSVLIVNLEFGISLAKYTFNSLLHLDQISCNFSTCASNSISGFEFNCAMDKLDFFSCCWNKFHSKNARNVFCKACSLNIVFDRYF